MRFFKYTKQGANYSREQFAPQWQNNLIFNSDKSSIDQFSFNGPLSFASESGYFYSKQDMTGPNLGGQQPRIMARDGNKILYVASSNNLYSIDVHPDNLTYDNYVTHGAITGLLGGSVRAIEVLRPGLLLVADNNNLYTVTYTNAAVGSQVTQLTPEAGSINHQVINFIQVDENTVYALGPGQTTGSVLFKIDLNLTANTFASTANKTSQVSFSTV